MTAVAEPGSFLAWREAFQAAEDACPWPGPRPLKESDGVRLLVGRERDRRLFNHEVQNHRLILLGGESGVGKSSLLDTGLKPDLENAGYTVVVCRNWGADIDADDDDTFLAQAVYQALDRDIQEKVSDKGRRAVSDRQGLDLFYKLDEQYGDWLVIIFDQFEELLRYNRNRKDRIVQRLIHVHHACSLRVVLSFRSEYLHELKDVETGATPFGISRYMLAPVEDRYAGEVIANTRFPSTTAIEDRVAAEIAHLWARARTPEGAPAGSTTQVGMLHLQAMLYALHARANANLKPGEPPRAIDESVFRAMRQDAKVTIGRYDADLFAFGLQQAVSIKLLRCQTAAAEQDMDRFLFRGAATLLSRIVSQLSSGGYKLVRETFDLAHTVLEDEIDTCVDALDDSPLGSGSKDDIKATLNRMVLAIAEDALRDDVESPSAEPFFGDEPRSVGDGLTATRYELADRADRKHRRDGEFLWSRVVSQHQGADSPVNPAAGPMRGLSPAEVLIEEFRRYAWALVWLKESNLIRITRHGQASMVSLIHDGFGEALLEWERSYKKQDRAAALYSLTAPEGESHLWAEDGSTWDEPGGGKGSMQGELSGAPDQPRIFANLVFKGNSIIKAEFANTVFVDCDFRGTAFLRCTFSGVTFLNCQLDGAIFSDCRVDGRPDPATDVPDAHDIEAFIPDDPKFNVPHAEVLARTFRHYAEDGAVGDAHLIANEAGQPAYAAEQPLPESDRWLPWEPAKAGLVLHGGRISALTFRGTNFVAQGQISFRGVVGSGLDLAELHGADIEFHRCLLRHVAFSTQQRHSAGLDVTVNYTVAAQWWFSQGFSGTVTATAARIGQIWCDSPQLQITKDKQTVDNDQIVTPGGPDYPSAAFIAAVSRTDYRRGGPSKRRGRRWESRGKGKRGWFKPHRP
jgi:hypothetical protein